MAVVMGLFFVSRMVMGVLIPSGGMLMHLLFLAGSVLVLETVRMGMDVLMGVAVGFGPMGMFMLVFMGMLVGMLMSVLAFHKSPPVTVFSSILHHRSRHSPKGRLSAKSPCLFHVWAEQSRFRRRSADGHLICIRKGRNIKTQEKNVATSNEKPNKTDLTLLDYLLYIMAGSAFLVVGFSFLLWLRF